MDIYYPLKKDTWGNKFGFVRFVQVTNSQQLLVELKTVWVGSFKLKIERAHVRGGQWKPCNLLTREHQKKIVTDVSDSGLGLGKNMDQEQRRTYAEAVRQEMRTGKELIQLASDHKTLELNVEQADMEWLNGAYMGRARDIEAIPLLQQKLRRDRFPQCTWSIPELPAGPAQVIGPPGGGVGQIGGIGLSLPINGEEADGFVAQGSDSVNLLLCKLKNRNTGKIGKPTKKLSKGLALKQNMKKLKSKGGLERKQKSACYKLATLSCSLMVEDGTSVLASYKEKESLSTSTNPKCMEASC
ncbi:hypothetical protein Ancab_009444 [Ancistrocladus abbreviatus]